MKKDIKERWVSLARKNKQHHGRGALRSRDNKFCPLGMLCEMAYADGVIGAPYFDEDADAYIYGGPGAEGSSGVLPKAVMKWAGLEEEDPGLIIDNKRTTITYANDRSMTSFTKIINAIERQL
jgi:hypothetical protein